MKINLNENTYTNFDGIVNHYGGQSVIIDAEFLGNPDDFIDGKWNNSSVEDINIYTINMPNGYGKGTDFIFDGRSVDCDLAGVLADMCHYCDVHNINSDYLSEEEYEQALEDGDNPEWFCEVTYSDSFTWKSPEHRPDIQYYLPEETMSRIRPQPTFDLEDYRTPEFQNILNNYILAYKIWDFTEDGMELGSDYKVLAEQEGVPNEVFATLNNAVDWNYIQLQSPDFRKSIYDYINIDACDDNSIDDEIIEYMDKLYPELKNQSDLDTEAQEMSKAANVQGDQQPGQTKDKGVI